MKTLILCFKNRVFRAIIQKAFVNIMEIVCILYALVFAYNLDWDRAIFFSVWVVVLLLIEDK